MNNLTSKKVHHNVLLSNTSKLCNAPTKIVLRTTNKFEANIETCHNAFIGPKEKNVDKLSLS